MRTTLTIAICKFTTFVCHLFKKNGTVYPGERALKFHKKVLSEIAYPKYVVVVTGSSGKGSAVSMIAHILENAGKKVVWNQSGSNILNAIATLVLNNSKIFSHELKADVLLLEMDERFIKETFAPGTITHLCITNITRDQPARNGHPLIVFESILEAIDKNVHLIINTDDPLLNRIKYAFENEITSYGIAKSNYDVEKPTYAVDFAYCPSCHTKLKYSSYHYGHLGIYECPKCSFKRGGVDYEAKNVDLKKGTFELKDKELKLNKKVFFGVYYTTLAYTVCDILGIDEDKILDGINKNMMATKRGKSYTLDNREIEMLESKNENSLSYLQSLNYIKMQEGKKTVVMGFENVSRRYSYNDLSWLWDVDFEVLNDKNIDKIFLIGRFKYDVAVRLNYAGVEDEKIILVDELPTLLDKIEQMSEGKIYTMVCFDMTETITKLLKERHDEKNN